MNLRKPTEYNPPKKHRLGEFLHAEAVFLLNIYRYADVLNLYIMFFTASASSLYLHNTIYAHLFQAILDCKKCKPAVVKNRFAVCTPTARFRSVHESVN